MFILLVVSGIIMILLGFIGVYVGYIFQEVKKRPIYLIRHIDHAPEDNPPFPPQAEDQAAAGTRPPVR